MPRTRQWPVSVWTRDEDRGRVAPLLGQFAVYGSDRVRGFIRDVIAGRDSLDIVTIGDSNMMYGTRIGWSGGWVRALHSLGATMYASPLWPTLFGVGSGQNGVGGFAGQVVQFPSFAGSPPSIASDSGGTATAYSLHEQSGAVPTSLKAFCVPDTVLRPFGLAGANWSASYLPASANAFRNFTQYIGHSGAEIAGGTVASGSDKTFIQNGSTYRHRVWHVKLTPNTPDGDFTIQVRNTSTGTDLVVGTAVTTHAAAYTLANSTVQFTASLTGTQNIRGGWAYLAVANAPVCPVWESWELRNAKGFAVQCMHGYAGASSTTISTDIDNADGLGGAMLPNYLLSLYQRQVANTGSGRVVIHCNFGINNGGDNFATWKASAEKVRTQIRASWVGAGLDLSLLGFVFEVTHPTDTGLTSNEANLRLARAAANAWASTYNDVVVCDLSQLFTGKQMTANGYYDSAGAGEAHLSAAGYLAVRTAMLRAAA